MVLVVGLLTSSGAQTPDSTRRPPVPVISPRYYAPGTFGPANERADSLIAYLVGKELAAAREPSLAEAGGPSYRFAIMGAWGLIRLIRLERRDSGYVLVRKATAVDSMGLFQRRLEVADSVYLSEKTVRAFETAFVAADFWHQPSFDMSMLDGADGDSWLIEAREHRGTKMIHRGERGLRASPLAELMRAVNALSADFLARGLSGR